MHRLLAVLFLCAFAFANTGYAQHHSSGSNASNHHSSKGKESKNRPVHVKSYHRKDGIYVASYNRRAPVTAATSRSSSSVVSAGHPYQKNYLADGYNLGGSVQRNSHGKIKRSKAAINAFERQSPCPSTGKTRGRCPGYVVDHLNPLECGGADAPSNMQWQTTTDGKAKDKIERECRLGGVVSSLH